MMFFFFSFPTFLSSPSIIMTSPSLIFSHFQSIPSPSHSHLSILIQINYTSPISFCVHLSKPICLISLPLVFTNMFSHDFSLSLFLLFVSVSVCNASLLYQPLFFFFLFVFLSLILLSDVESLLPEFRWIDKNIAFEKLNPRSFLKAHTMSKSLISRSAE